MPARQVLLVEDDQPTLRLLERWFLDEGYDVITCPGFEPARLYLGSQAPDVLVTDIRLGAFNGLHLVVIAKQARPDTIVIVVSGIDDPVLAKEAERAGAHYLAKPLRRDELLKCAELPAG